MNDDCTKDSEKPDLNTSWCSANDDVVYIFDDAASSCATSDDERSSSIHSSGVSVEQETTTGQNNPSNKRLGYRFPHPTDDTVDILRPEVVRWFYRGEKDKRWIAFIGYDSLRIETKYRQLKSHPDFVDGPQELVMVRGGLFEVDVIKRLCVPIYWTGKEQQSSAVVRGSWFREGSWKPVPEEMADQLEFEHLKRFRGVRVSESPYRSLSAERNRSPIQTVKFKDSHVDWYDVMEVFLFTQSTSLQIRQKLGMQKVGSRLSRGYREEATMDDKPPDITHICFVIHGIGQKMRTGSIVQCCDDLRKMCTRVKDRLFPDVDESNQRCEFLSVEWRSALRLDGDTVDAITPGNMRGLRTLLNSSALDILYYTSPLYRSEIIQGLQTELNRLYSMFCARQPYFEANGGKVSIIAHSLGAVITYDILMGWTPGQLYAHYVPTSKEESEPSERKGRCDRILEELQTARKRVNELELELLNVSESPEINIQALSFRQANFPTNFKSGDLWRKIPKLDNFFCLGSPLSVFLALRGVRPSPDGTPLRDLIPKSVCNRIFNIYHPADPVAYRLEPLTSKRYSEIIPMMIHRYHSLSKPSYDSIAEQNIKPADKMKPEPPKQYQVSAPISADQGTVSETLPDSSSVLDNEGSESKLDDTEIRSTIEDTCDDLPTQNTSASRGRMTRWLNRFRRERVTIESENRENSVSPSQHLTLETANQIERTLAMLNDRSPSPTYSGTSSFDKESTVTNHVGSTRCFNSNTQVLQNRLDYQLRESRYESTYLAVLTSHTSYWANQDVALFIMTHIFPELGPIGIPKSK